MCKMSEEWILQMNVDSQPPGRHQPFYNVLAHDGSNRYAAQGQWKVGSSHAAGWCDLHVQLVISVSPVANLMDCP